MSISGNWIEADADNKIHFNVGFLFDDIYYDAFNREAIPTMNQIIASDASNVYNSTEKSDNDTYWTTYSKGTSPINITDVELLDSSVSGDECDSASIGCIGYVLPGETLFRASFE